MENSEYSRYRKLEGPAMLIWKTILILIPIIGIAYVTSIYQYFGLSFFTEQYTGLFFGLILAAVFMGVPAVKKITETKIPWYDWLLSLLGLVVGIYITVFYPQIALHFSSITAERLVMSILAVVLILEALRRVMGWLLVIVVAVFLTYAFISPYMPGMLKGQSISFDILFNYLYLDTNSILSLVGLAATIVLAFILFGQILLNFEGADHFNNMAIKAFGKYRGGPAKAAIIGSSMVGSVTGDPVSNVNLTGNMTIPLMIKSGYSRVQAGAIEALASTGGSITPPVMGIVAFMMAENLGVPYAEVALAAIIPAFLFYMSLFIQVDLRAAKEGIKGTPKESLPKLNDVLKTGWVLIPIFAFLVYFLFVKGYPPATVGIYTSGFAIVCLLIQKEVRKNILGRLVNSFFTTGRILLEIGIILAAAGIIAGIIGVTGLGFNLVLALTQLGEQGLLILLLASAAVCIILGMGMPALVAYAIVATLIAPALVELGVQPMAAHLFVFYFSLVSNFTLPVALACFAAAPIAQANPHKISLMAMKLGVMVYVIPFIFVYNPIVLISFHTEYDSLMLMSIITSILGVVMIAISTVGYFSGKISIINRTLLVLFSILLILPIQNGIVQILNVIAVLASIGILSMNWYYYRRRLSLRNSSEITTPIQ
ncbi:TRAP transporter permease [Bacillus sp. Marseille-P3661]|uniref:TRAP transporter permease n=1 Tax=Bacillus sp. Marseille-P3661 TaxID=1936234 RepID=UPI000C82E301|nr:TRAP transporter fused permease subunit [Bacillus sp. Marseille-P3661]